MTNSAAIHVMDNLLPVELCRRVWHECQAPRWCFGHASTEAEEAPFWKLELDGVVAVDQAWQAAQPRCEELVGMRLAVLRQYANGHTTGLGGQVHTDDRRERHFTLVYYPMLRWDPKWGGETVFHETAGDIIQAVIPKPNRGILFDARIPHVGRAPLRSFSGLRVTVAFKLGPSSAQPNSDDDLENFGMTVPRVNPGF